jgi:hypothetical protein
MAATLGFQWCALRGKAAAKARVGDARGGAVAYKGREGSLSCRPRMGTRARGGLGWRRSDSAEFGSGTTPRRG